jgi:predicted ATPase
MVENAMPAPKRKVSRKVSRKPPKLKPIVPVSLNRVELRSFKAATAADLRLGMFNVVIGRNGAGKSTLIEALQWIDQAVRDGARSASDRYHGIHDLINVQGKRRPQDFALGLGWTQGTAKRHGQYDYSVRVRESSERLPVIERELLDRSTANGFRHLIDTKKDGLRVVSPTPRSSVVFEDSDQLALSFASRIADSRRAVRASDLAPINDFWSRAVFLRLSPSRLAQTSAPQRKPSAPLLDEEGHQLPALLNELTDAQRIRMVRQIESVLADFKEVAVSEPGSARDEQVFYSLIEEMPSGKTKRSTMRARADPRVDALRGHPTAHRAVRLAAPRPAALAAVHRGDRERPRPLDAAHGPQASCSRPPSAACRSSSPPTRRGSSITSSSRRSSTCAARTARPVYERFADRADVKAYQGRVPAGAIYVHEEP